MEEKRWILITGGTGTLGSALVRVLSQQNQPVIANYWRDEARAETLQQETGCELIRADVRDLDAVHQLMTTRPLAAVIHCAGAGNNSLLARTSPDAWRDMLATHADSAFFIVREATNVLPVGSQIILVGSRVGLIGNIGQSSYSAAKAAVHGLTKTAAREAAPMGIRVNAVLPGFAPSAMSVGMSHSMSLQRAEENLLSETNAATAFAEFTAWLLSTPTYITGQLLRPDCRIP